MERGLEVLVGKLAIGRGLLSREAAVRCFHASNGEPFWKLAVREKLLTEEQADDLVRTVEAGSLICRGECGAIARLDAARPPANDRCEKCGGPVFVVREAPVPETPRRENGTSRDAAWNPDDAVTIAPDRSVATPAREESFEDAPTNPMMDPPPAPAKLPSGEPVRTSPTEYIAAGDSLPSAVPLPPRERPATPAWDPARDEETKGDSPPSAGGFVPFAISHYDVIAPIGRGGMGSVFRARQRTVNRIVAIKILTVVNGEQRARFDREMKTTAKLAHPNIVQILGGGTVKTQGDYHGCPYFAMEYVAGRDLVGWLQESRREPRECAKILVELCDAIHFAHNRGIIHRDLKPQNILIAHQGDLPKICDFGLAKIADSDLTRTGDIMGTPQFMPPEQLLGRRHLIGPPTDVYGLGAILYYLLVGNPPFVETKFHELTRRVVRDMPASARAKNPAVPVGLEEVLVRALAKEPVQRFHTARDLGRALAAFAS